MHKMHYYQYAPIIIGATQRYKISLPSDTPPVLYKTMTTGMRAWTGQLVKCAQGRSTALIQEAGKVIEVDGMAIDWVKPGHPCVVMEHLNIKGEMEFMVGSENILNGDLNFINLGIPSSRHLRIDIYTGDSRIMD